MSSYANVSTSHLEQSLTGFEEEIHLEHYLTTCHTNTLSNFDQADTVTSSAFHAQPVLLNQPDLVGTTFSWGSHDTPWAPLDAFDLDGDSLNFSTSARLLPGQREGIFQSFATGGDVADWPTDVYGADGFNSPWDMASVMSTTESTLYPPSSASAPCSQIDAVDSGCPFGQSNWNMTFGSMDTLSEQPWSHWGGLSSHLPDNSMSTVVTSGIVHHPPCTSSQVDVRCPIAHEESRYVCPEAECTKDFRRQQELFRHMKTKHPEKGQGWKCASDGCRKAGKIWTRLDSFKKHAIKRHSGIDMDDFVRRSTRRDHGPDANYSFSVATPASMSNMQRAHISRTR